MTYDNTQTKVSCMGQLANLQAKLVKLIKILFFSLATDSSKDQNLEKINQVTVRYI